MSSEINVETEYFIRLFKLHEKEHTLYRLLQANKHLGDDKLTISMDVE